MSTVRLGKTMKEEKQIRVTVSLTLLKCLRSKGTSRRRPAHPILMFQISDVLLLRVFHEFDPIMNATIHFVGTIS